MRTLLLLGLVIPFASGATQDKQNPDPREQVAALQKDITQTGDAQRQIRAAMSLADLGPLAEPAIPALLAALQSKHADGQTQEELRLNAAIALGKIGKATVPSLRKLLTSDDQDTRFYAIWALGWVGPDAKEAAPALVQAMADKDENIRRKAAYALGRIAADPQQTVQVLLAAFKDDNEDVRQAASDAVAKFGKAAVPGLIAALKDRDARARVQAARAITEIGTDAKEAASALRELLLGKDQSDSLVLAQALGKLGSAGVPALIEAFKDSRPQIRQAGTQGLMQAGAAAVPALVDAMGDKNVEVRRLAVQVLAPLRVSDKMVVTALAYAIKNDADDQVRQQCVRALQYLGAQGKLGVPALQYALADPNNQVRQQAFYTLQALGENPRDGLLKALANKDDRIRINTAGLMLQVNVEANRALPVLVDALKHDNDEMRMQAAHSLAQARRETDKLLPFFRDGLKSRTPRVRIQALQGFAMLGNQSRDVVQGVIDALSDGDAGVRQQAIGTLQSIPGNANTALPALTRLFKEDKGSLRLSIVGIVWRYGPKGMPLLLEAVKDDDVAVRRQATWAMMNVQGDLSAYVPELVARLDDKDVQLRYNMLNLLCRGGEAGAKALVKVFTDSKDSNTRSQILQVMLYSQARAHAVPLVKQAVKDPDRNVRITAIRLLPNLGATQEATDMLAEALKDQDLNVRVAAVYGLQNFGPKGMPLLEKALATAKESQLRQALLQGMLNYNHRSKAMVAPLTECLKDSQPQVRWQAAQVLGNIGTDARAAVPALEGLLNDANPTVRQQAQLAINRIAPPKQ